MSQAGPVRVFVNACAGDREFAEALATALRAVGRASEADDVEERARGREGCA